MGGTNQKESDIQETGVDIMALSNYSFAIVRKIIIFESKDVIGEDTMLVLAQPYRSVNLDIYTVTPSLRSVIEEGGL